MRRRTIALILIWTLPSALFVAATAIVYAAFRIPAPERLDDADRAAVMASLRGAVAGQPEVPCTVRRTGAGPVAVTVWANGRAVVRVDGDGPDIGRAVDAAAAALRSQPALRAMPVADRDTARIQVDVVTGTAPLGGGQWLFDALAVPGVGDMLAINSGIEGIGVVSGHDEKTWLLLPHELVFTKVLAAKKPSAALQDFAMGADLDRMATMLAARAGTSAKLDRESLFRFRTDTFVEGPRGASGRSGGAAGEERPGGASGRSGGAAGEERPGRASGRSGGAAGEERPDRSRTPGAADVPIRLTRGIPEPPALSARVLRDAALDGGRFLVAHLAPSGRYVYEHDVATGAQTDPKSASYSMPRHAGTTYFLAELYRITKQAWLREPIERAFAHLAELMANGRCAGKLPDGTEIDCVMDRTERIAQMGSTALAVVALAEYQRATGDPRYLATAKKLAAWILWMQRADGSFRHLYDPATRLPDNEAQLLYYSGEAALALARMFAITKDPTYARAAERGLDWLVDWYDFFMGGFFYGEEHWTCIAAEAAYPAVDDPKLVEFCHGYGAFLRQQQAEPGDFPDEDDWAGAYVFTPFLAPYNTPAGSRTEAMISAYLLGRHHGTPDPRVRDQIRATLQYALGQQIRPDNDFAVIGPGLGGMPASPIDRNIRIDYVQHVCSAMIRASEWIDDDAR